MQRLGRLIACGVLMGGGFLMAFQPLRAETIKIGYFDHKPHQYEGETSEKPRGATIVFFENVAEKMGYDVEWVGPLPILRLFEYLKNGTIDGTAHMVRVPELADSVYYPDQPFHYAQSIFVVRKENPLESIATIDDVKGYRIGWLDGVPPSLFVQEHSDQLTIEKILSATAWEQHLKKLVAGRLDAVHDLNAYTLLFQAKRAQIDQRVKALSLPEPPAPVFVMFSRQSSKGKTLVAQYNQVFAEMQFTPEDYYKFVDEEFDSFP